MNKLNRVKFITAKDEQGKLILEYFDKTCQQALNFCNNNNLQSYEEFAQTIKVIGDKNAELKGEHLAIRVGIKKDDLVLSLANRPQSGATKSIKMLEHLGKEKKYQYTRPKVEELLQKNKSETSNEFNAQELSDFSSSINDGYDLIERGRQENGRLNDLDFIDKQSSFDERERTDNQTEITDDLLFEEERSQAHEDAINELLNNSAEEKKENSNKKQQSDIEIKSKAAQKKTQKGNANSSIAHRSSKSLMSLAHKADSYTNDTDGMTVIAASLRMGAVGVALANNLLEKKEEQKLKKTIDRILAIQKKSDRVLERSKSLEIKTNQEKSKTNSEELDFDDQLDINGRIPVDNQLDENEDFDFDDESDVNKRIPVDNQLDENEDLDFSDELDVEKDISRQLGKAVNNINQQIKNIDSDISTEPIIIDQNADFDKQLAQINAALDRLEQKLDSLEKRIEHLEQSLNNQQESIKNYVEIDSEDNSDIWHEDELEQQNKEAEELDSEDDSDNWNQNEIDEQNRKADEVNDNLVNTLLETSIKYKQINPDSDSGIPIGGNCQLCTSHNDTTTIITIEEQNEKKVSEIFKATLNYDTNQYFLDKDKLSTEEKQGIVEGFSQKLKEIDAFLAQRQAQTQSTNSQSKRQKQMDLA